MIISDYLFALYHFRSYADTFGMIISIDDVELCFWQLNHQPGGITHQWLCSDGQDRSVGSNMCPLKPRDI